jgi:hypothetical protein
MKDLTKRLQDRYKTIKNYSKKRDYDYFVNYYNYIKYIEETEELFQFLQYKILDSKTQLEDKVNKKRLQALEELKNTFKDVKNTLEQVNYQNSIIEEAIKDVDRWINRDRIKKEFTVEDVLRRSSSDKLSRIKSLLVEIIRYAKNNISEDVFNRYAVKSEKDTSKYKIKKKEISNSYESYGKLIERIDTLYDSTHWGDYLKLKEIYNAIKYIKNEGRPRPIDFNLGGKGRKYNQMFKIKAGKVSPKDDINYYLDKDKKYGTYLERFHKEFRSVIKNGKITDKNKKTEPNQVESIKIKKGSEDNRRNLLINDKVLVEDVKIESEDQWRAFYIMAKNKVQNDGFGKLIDFEKEYGINKKTAYNINSEGCKLFSNNDIERTQIVEEKNNALRIKEDIDVKIED